MISNDDLFIYIKLCVYSKLYYDPNIGEWIENDPNMIGLIWIDVIYRLICKSINSVLLILANENQVLSGEWGYDYIYKVLNW